MSYRLKHIRHAPWLLRSHIIYLYILPGQHKEPDVFEGKLCCVILENFKQMQIEMVLSFFDVECAYIDYHIYELRNIISFSFTRELWGFQIDLP